MPSVRIDLLLIDSVQLSLKCEITRWLATGHHNFFSGSREWYCDRTRPHISGTCRLARRCPNLLWGSREWYCDRTRPHASGIWWLARGCPNFFCGSKRRQCDKAMYSALRRGFLLLKNREV